MKFLDEAKIHIGSGNGGPGCISFRREANVPHGGPDGGDGGTGGSVYVEALPALNTLIDFRYKQHFKARNGEPGMGKNRTGASADDLVILVPTGTQILAEDKKSLIADLKSTGDRVLLARGGIGGRGNTRFKSATNRAPRRHDSGEAGEQHWVWLCLKLIADVGIIGLPNAGKSTFLSAVTRAKPRIADYPFTTLVPQMGVARQDEREIVLADIPGLIEGAHLGTGLGTRFLSHVERCGVLLHLVDGTLDDVVTAYRTIRSELEAYETALEKKAEVVALNKCDALDRIELETRIDALHKISGKSVLLLSASTGHGCATVLRHLYDHVKRDHETSIGEGPEHTGLSDEATH